MLKNKITRLRRFKRILFLLCSFNSSLYAPCTNNGILAPRANADSKERFCESSRLPNVTLQTRIEIRPVGQGSFVDVGEFDVNRRS